MIKLLKRIMGVILIFLTVTTISLYTVSNADLLLSAIASAMPAQKEPEPITDETPEQTEPPAEAGSEARLTDQPDIDTALSGGKALPAFLFQDVMGYAGGDVSQAVVVLGSGSTGNLWVLEKQGGVWYALKGPIYCRLGRGGISQTPQPGDSVTPLGVSRIKQAYAGAEIEGLKMPVSRISDGDIWITDRESDKYNTMVRGANPSGYRLFKALSPQEGSLYLDIGYNEGCDKDRPAGIFLQAGGSLGTATDGSISIAYEHMREVVGLLEPEKNPVMCVFAASAVGWEIETGINENFVYLGDIAPNIKEDVRYATGNNFTGRPLEGYLGNRVIVLKEVAQALKTVQEELEKRGLGLIVYDGYRPKRAVEDIFGWMKNDDASMKARFYPEIEKGDLKGIYLAEHSPHTYGIAVDLSVIDLATGEPLDMGTEFDYFSPLSWYDSNGVTQQQKICRKILRDVMVENGFESYEKEWWHFNYLKQGKKTVYDFVIPQ